MPTTSEEDFNPLDPDDLSSESVFDGAVKSFGGMRTTHYLGDNLAHRNADWVFPKRRAIVEHKELNASFTDAPTFKDAAVELGLKYASSGRANIFGVPNSEENWLSYGREYAQLFRKPLRRVLESANRQLRETRARLGWSTGSNVVVLSNRSLVQITPLAICVVVEGILTDIPSEIHGIGYVTNHYVDIPGSHLANVVWLPVYRRNGRVSRRLINFVDGLGAEFMRHLAQTKGDPPEARKALPAGSEDASRVLRARRIAGPK
jgi:hypothetical protein